MQRALALVLVVGASVAPMLALARDAASVSAVAAWAIACAAVVWRRRADDDWLVAAFPVAGGCLLALGLDVVTDVSAADAGLVAQEPGHTPLIALRALTLAVVYWATIPREHGRARVLIAHALLVAASTLHVALLALPLVSALFVLAQARAPAPVFPGLALPPRALAVTVCGLALGLFAFGALAPPPAASTGPPAGDDPVALTRYWMDERDNVFRAAPHARRWAAREVGAPGEGTLRLARLGLRAGELDAARVLLRDVASGDAPAPVREQARRLLAEARDE